MTNDLTRGKKPKNVTKSAQLCLFFIPSFCGRERKVSQRACHPLPPYSTHRENTHHPCHPLRQWSVGWLWCALFDFRKSKGGEPAGHIGSRTRVSDFDDVKGSCAF
jgi:hypothetical protein